MFWFEFASRLRLGKVGFYGRDILKGCKMHQFGTSQSTSAALHQTHKRHEYRKFNWHKSPLPHITWDKPAFDLHKGSKTHENVFLEKAEIFLTDVGDFLQRFSTLETCKICQPKFSEKKNNLDFISSNYNCFQTHTLVMILVWLSQYCRGDIITF